MRFPWSAPPPPAPPPPLIDSTAAIAAAVISVILTILAIESCLSWLLKPRRLAARPEEKSGGGREEKEEEADIVRVVLAAADTHVPEVNLTLTASHAPFRVAYDENSEREQDEKYDVDNLLFVGMVRTMRYGDSLLSAPVLLGMASLLVKVMLTVAVVFRFYFQEVLTTGQWGELLSQCPMWYDKAGLVSSLIAAPAFLLHSLSETSEFKDSAVMWATLQKLNEQHKNRKLLYIMWSIVHVVRTYLLMPCCILGNAGLIAYTAAGVAGGDENFFSLLSDTFAAGLVLEIDNYFFGLYKKLGGKIAPANACVRLGAKTQTFCDRVVQSQVLILGIAQLALVVLMKTSVNQGSNLLWSVPLVAAALSRAYGVFPRGAPAHSNSD